MIATRPQLAAEEFEEVLTNVRAMTVRSRAEHLLATRSNWRLQQKLSK
ncbi:MAG: hypothetical protein ACI9GW_003724 [Halieaceae bacterium]|jgi:hypothetical protein